MPYMTLGANHIKICVNPALPRPRYSSATVEPWVLMPMDYKADMIHSPVLGAGFLEATGFAAGFFNDLVATAFFCPALITVSEESAT